MFVNQVCLHVLSKIAIAKSVNAWPFDVYLPFHTSFGNENVSSIVIS